MAGFDEWKPEGATWDDASDLWELQTGPHLTARSLLAVLSQVDPDLPVRACLYDGTEARRIYDAVEIGYIGAGTRPDAIIITIADIG